MTRNINFIVSEFNNIKSSIDEHIYNLLHSKTTILFIIISGFFIIQEVVAPQLGIKEIEVFRYSLNSLDPVGLFFSMFSHSGPAHFIVNSIVLFIFGYTIEKYYTKLEFYSLFIIGSMLVDLLLKVTYVVMPMEFTTVLGSSGGISVLIGASVIILYKKENWNKYSPITLIFKPASLILTDLEVDDKYIELLYSILMFCIGMFALYVFITKVMASGNGFSGGVVHISHLYGFIIGFSIQLITTIK